MTSRRTDVAVVGMACRYPGAASPRELWENALAGRRAFRRIPAERLRLDDYAGDGPDSITLREAAVLEDWQLDRVAFRIAGAAWRAADHAHWLALEVAARALDDAGTPGGEGLDREATGVLVGNSLTGEFSRAGQMRLRWPYVRRTVAAGLAEAGWEAARREDFLAALEERYKEPFPEPGEETLAGGLANTIAGRIANHFDFHGGGYTVDGACASSLLAVANACSALAAGDLEVALAGGVDLSLDPFELVGFSRTGAFARDRMRVYDARSSGFLPGEGCGMVVLVPHETAVRRGMRIHAVIRGWGLSSDGAGGLTRPKADGQLLALRRAYRGAGFAAATVGYFEGHGTGTAVGDPVELEALSRARREETASPGAAAVGSIKAVIGHTKAAAGVAGLLKAVMAVREGVLPPTIGCEEPHPALAAAEGGAVLRTLERAEAWPLGSPRRAGVSAFGFGGINAHVVLESGDPGVASGEGEAAAVGAKGAVPAGLPGRAHRELPASVARLDASRQDAELLLLAAPDRASLGRRATELAARVESLSEAELTDLAVELAAHAETALAGHRGSVVASRPAEAAQRLRALAAAIEAGDPAGGAVVDLRQGLAAGGPDGRPRIGFLFPGQGVPGRQASAGEPLFAGAWARRFPEYEAAVRDAVPEGLPEAAVRVGPGAPGSAPRKPGPLPTEVVQPALVAASLGARAVLGVLGVQAVVAVGHSLGEISALGWAGAFDVERLVALARARGAAMAAVPGDGGALASLACDADTAAELVAATGAVVAGLNAPRQTVIAGSADAVEAVRVRGRQRQVASSRVPVSHAFHSPAMAPAAEAVAGAVAAARPRPPVRRVVSTVTGEAVPPDADLAPILVRQLTEPVLFTRALAVAEGRAEAEGLEQTGDLVVGDGRSGDEGPGDGLEGRGGAARSPGGAGAGSAASFGAGFGEGARERAASGIDLWIEVGPGRVLADLVQRCGGAPAVALDAGGASLAGLLVAVGTAWALGARLDVGALFRDRFHRVLRPHAFLANPCESAPLEIAADGGVSLRSTGEPVPAAGSSRAEGSSPATGVGGPAPHTASPTPVPAELSADRQGATELDPLELVRHLVARRAELPASAVGEHDRLLSDLHLNSIAVGQLVVEAARRLGAPPPASPTDYADASVGEIAEVVASRAGTDPGAAGEAGPPAGVDTWIRAFLRHRIERELPAADGERAPVAAGSGAGVVPRRSGTGTSFHIAAGDSPGERILAEALRRELADGPEASAESAELLILLLPPTPGAADLERLLSVGQAAFGGSGEAPPTWAGDPPHRGSAAARGAAGRPLPRLVLVHRGAGAGFLRSLHLERPGGEVVLLEVAPERTAPDRGAPDAATPGTEAPGLAALARRLVADAVAPVPSGGFREAVYDAAGRRHEPRLEVLPGVVLGHVGSGDGESTDGELGDAAEQGRSHDGSARPADTASSGAPPLGPDDVVLVTGGGRGIAAECALDLARRSGAAVALVGRSRPEEAPDLAANLERFAASGLRFRYLAADVTDRTAVTAAVEEARRELGEVTAVLHGAGRNRPRRVVDLAVADVERTRAVKVDGLEHVLEAVDAGRLRLLVAFGSIIAEMGVRGEADYALANELLARRVERFAREHPSCRCLTAAWSVWSGVGMGERLGTLESLRAQGISPIPLDAGVAALRQLLGRPDLPPTLVVAGRFGAPPTLALEPGEIPFLRFLETPRVHVPGVELVIESEISDASDPYLADHVFDGERLFPAVLGLEAMAQAAVALAGGGAEGGTLVGGGSVASRIAFEDVRFERPISVPAGERAVLRVAALLRAPGRVEAVVRCSATGFQVDHFAALCRLLEGGEAGGFPEAIPATAPSPRAAPEGSSEPGSRAALAAAGPPSNRQEPAQEAVALEPGRDLYGSVLFHAGRFRRLQGYRLLRATRCVADIGPAPQGPEGAWFARHLPASLLLGDPGGRDAVLHAVQASIPHATVLPTGVEAVWPGRLDAGSPHRVVARERSRDGRDLLYDLDVLDAAGQRVECWRGLGLRAVAERPAPEAWPLALLAPHVERRLGDLVPGARPAVALTAAALTDVDPTAVAPTATDAAEAGRQAASDRAVAAAAGGPVVRFRRPDGRRAEAVSPPPEAEGDGPGAVSVSYGDGLVLAVVGTAEDGEVGCDLEAVVHREPEVWSGLLGSRTALAEHLAAREARSVAERPGGVTPFDLAATRVWAAGEALKKAGAPVDAPLTAGPEGEGRDDGWRLLVSGGRRVAVLLTRVRRSEPPSPPGPSPPPAGPWLALAVALPARPAAQRTGSGRRRAS